MPRSLPLRALVAGSIFAAALTGTAPGLGPPPALAADETWNFGYAGHRLQYFTVPAGMSQVSAIVSGGAGGQTNSQIGVPGGVEIAIATLQVQPGQQFTIWVGGNSNDDTGGGQGGWGFGCGGARGTGAVGKDGGGGGGGSALLLGHFTNPDCNATPGSTLELIAGGGGGGGGNGAVIYRPDGGAGGSGGGPGLPGSVAPAGSSNGGCGG